VVVFGDICAFASGILWERRWKLGKEQKERVQEFWSKGDKKKDCKKREKRRSRKMKTKFAIEESKRVSSMSWQEMLQKEKERQEKQAKKHTPAQHAAQPSSTRNKNTTPIKFTSRANPFFLQQIDRNRRRHDRNHGPLGKLQPHHHTNRTRTLQIPHSIFSASEDREGMFVLSLPFPFHLYSPSPPFVPFIQSPRIITNWRPQKQLDKYPHHHLSSPNLSTTESQYITHRCTLLSHHFSTSFLSSFPPQLQKLDDTAGGISMVDAPDTDAAVFVRVLRDAGHVEVQGEAGVGVVELRRGDVWCVRWSAVREACLRGDVEMV
jgi:hypothetical protein